MGEFYKITKETATLIGQFKYGHDDIFNPFCAEQVDGTHLVSVELVNELIEHPDIAKINWNNLAIIDAEVNNPKIININ